jgi:hypothetical protein
MRATRVRRLTYAVFAAAVISAVPAGAASAREQVCIPFNGPTLLVVAEKEFWLPGHSLPCQDVG